MNVTLSTIGKFHTFDLARELERKGSLVSIYSGYPRFKLRHEKLPASKIKTFPWLRAPYMAFPGLKKRLSKSALWDWEYLTNLSFDRYTSRRLPDCDVFCGLSGSGLLTGKVAAHRGIKYICDRGSSHIKFQEEILKEEYAFLGMKFSGIDPRMLKREEEEYAAADKIIVPSQFVFKSFCEKGIAPEKLRIVPYGVDLQLFHQTDTPPKDEFNVLFVGNLSVRKGITYLLEAFEKFQHPNKRLFMVGSRSIEGDEILKKFSIPLDQMTVTGPMPQVKLKEIMSRSHVMVLPSLEEGLALVQAQAMACGCPLISSENTGAHDLFTENVEGFITPIRDSKAIEHCLTKLADSPELREKMSAAALSKVKSIGGWGQYGDVIHSVFLED